MKYLLSFFLAVACFFNVSAQEEETDWKLYKPVNESGKDTATKGGTYSIQTNINIPFSGKEGKLTVSKDPRIDPLTEFIGTPQNGKVNVMLKGYRIQASLDRDKNKINQLRADYLAKFNEQPAYIDFLAPNFRLRIGDFRTKLDAYCFLEKIKILFPDAIIVMDDIELPKY